MKLLVMCEGPNELEIMRMLLENDRLCFTEDDLLGLTPYHARQISSSPQVRAALDMYTGEVIVYRIGDKQSDKLKIPGGIGGRMRVFNVCLACFKVLHHINNNLHIW